MRWWRRRRRVNPQDGPRDTQGEDDGQAMTGPYDAAGLPAQPAHDSPRCHVCQRPRVVRKGGYVCPVCDETGVPPW
jgi:hypothetical protein